MTIHRPTLERAWNLVPVLRQPTFTATDLIRSYDALVDLWIDAGEGGADAEGLRNDLAVTHETPRATAASSANSSDVCRNLQVICFLLLEMSVLDPGQAVVVASSLESATRILLCLRRKGRGVESRESGEIGDSVLEVLQVELVKGDILGAGCDRYRWSASSASIGVSIVMDRAALAAEAAELWRMAHTPVPNEDDG
jgi:hypothetical protein